MASARNWAIAGLLCLQTLFACLSSTISQYIYASYLQSYPNSSASVLNETTTLPPRPWYSLQAVDNQTGACPQTDLAPDRDAQAWAQQRSAELFFWLQLISSCPVIIMTYVLGLYTPRLGKRFVLVLPMLGMISQTAIWLAIIYFHLREVWWYIAGFLVGLSGSSGLLGLTLNLVIIENTTESQRSSCFVRLGAMQTTVSAIATFGVGHYIHWRGFVDLYWMALSTQLLSLAMVALLFKSASTSRDERVPLLSSVNDESHAHSTTACGDFFQVCTVLRGRHRTKKKTISLILTLLANLFYAFATTAFAPFLWFLLNTPFCWTSQDIGNYSALGAISFAILSVVGMKLLTWANATDIVICMISEGVFCLWCLWVALARYSWQLYAGLLLSAFSGYQGSLTASMMSKWLEPDERSSVLTLVTESNTIVATLGNALFNWIYARTVVNFRNLTFFIAIGLGLIPLVLNICLFAGLRCMSDGEAIESFQETTDPVPLSIPHDLLPHAGDAACVRSPSRPSIASLYTPSTGRSRANSVSKNEIQEAIYPEATDSNIL